MPFWFIIVGIAILLTGISVSFIAKKRKEPTEAAKDYASCLFALTLHEKDSQTSKFIARKWFSHYGAMLFREQKQYSGGVYIGSVMMAINPSYANTTAENKKKLKQRIEDVLLTGMNLRWRSSGTIRISDDGGITYVLTGGCKDWGLVIRYCFTLVVALVVTVVTVGQAWETLAAAVVYVALDIYSKEYADVEWNDETIARYKQDCLDAYTRIEAAYEEGGEYAVGELAANYAYDRWGPDAP